MIGPPSVNYSDSTTRVAGCEQEIRRRIREGSKGPAESSQGGIHPNELEGPFVPGRGLTRPLQPTRPRAFPRAR